MSGQPGDESEPEDKRQAMIQYLFWTVVAVALGYVLIVIF